MADAERRSIDDGDFQGLKTLQAAVPTRRHGEMAFDMVVSALGERAWIESWNDRALRHVFRREDAGSPFVLPWRVASMTRGGREGPSPLPSGVPGVYDAPKRRPGPAPRMRDLGPGNLQIYDGPDSLTVTYGADGRWFEGTVAGRRDAFDVLVAALTAGEGLPAECVARHLVGVDSARHGRGRVFLPVPVPGGVGGVWNCGLHAIRDALFRGSRPTGAGAVAADGWTGRLVLFGETRDDVMGRWHDAVARERPFPAPPQVPDGVPQDPHVEMETGDAGFRMHAVLRGPSSDTPRVEPDVENTPAAFVTLEDPPTDAPPFGEWVPLVGVFGQIEWAALRWEPEGFTLLGEKLWRTLAPFDADSFERTLDAADAASDARAAEMEAARDAESWRGGPETPERPKYDTIVRTYRFVHPRTHEPVEPGLSGTSRRNGFDARAFDGGRLTWEAVRMRRLIAS